MTLVMIFHVSGSFPLHADWQKSNSSVDGEPQGNWRRNSNSRDVVATLLPFPAPPPEWPEWPGELAHRLSRDNIAWTARRICMGQNYFISWQKLRIINNYFQYRSLTSSLLLVLVLVVSCTKVDFSKKLGIPVAPGKFCRKPPLEVRSRAFFPSLSIQRKAETE